MKDLSMRQLAWAWVAVLSLAAALGCSREGGKDASRTEKDKSPVVARVGQSAITLSEFKDYLSRRPPPTDHRVSEGDVAKRLDEMILQELLYQEALREELDQDPEVRERIRQLLTQKLVDERINQKEWNRDISDDELKKYYDLHREEFNRPAEVRIADIFVSVGAEATEEQRAESRKKAEAALAEAAGMTRSRTGFGNLVKKYSDTHQKYGKSDSGFFDKEGRPIGFDRDLAEAAFELEQIGSIGDRILETPEGYHVIMLLGKRSAVHKPLKAVRNQLISQIHREAVAKARLDYFAGLKERAEIEIDQKLMAETAKEWSKTARAETPPPLPSGSSSGRGNEQRSSK